MDNIEFCHWELQVIVKHDRKRVTLLQSTTEMEHTSPLVFSNMVL